MFRIFSVFKKTTAPTAPIAPTHPLVGKQVSYMNKQMVQGTSTESVQDITVSGFITGVVDADTFEVDVAGEVGTYTRIAPHFPFFNRTDLQGNPRGEKIVFG